MSWQYQEYSDFSGGITNVKERTKALPSELSECYGFIADPKTGFLRTQEVATLLDHSASGIGSVYTGIPFVKNDGTLAWVCVSAQAGTINVISLVTPGEPLTITTITTTASIANSTAGSGGAVNIGGKLYFFPFRNLADKKIYTIDLATNGLTNFVAPDVVSAICYHKEKLYVASGSKIYFSAAGQPATIDPLDMIDVKREILRIVSETDRIVVYTWDRVFYLFGTTRYDYDIETAKRELIYSVNQNGIFEDFAYGLYSIFNISTGADIIRNKFLVADPDPYVQTREVAWNDSIGVGIFTKRGTFFYFDKNGSVYEATLGSVGIPFSMIPVNKTTYPFINSAYLESFYCLASFSGANKFFKISYPYNEVSVSYSNQPYITTINDNMGSYGNKHFRGVVINTRRTTVGANLQYALDESDTFTSVETPATLAKGENYIPLYDAQGKNLQGKSIRLKLWAGYYRMEIDSITVQYRHIGRYP